MPPLLKHSARTALVLISALAAPVAAAETLLDFEPGFDLKRVETRDAEVALHGSPPATSLEVKTGNPSAGRGSLSNRPARLDLSGAARPRWR